jgi:hypothetical protein
MNFDAALDTALNRLHEEGRYRTFIEIERARTVPACGLDKARWQPERYHCLVRQ